MSDDEKTADDKRSPSAPAVLIGLASVYVYHRALDNDDKQLPDEIKPFAHAVPIWHPLIGRGTLAGATYAAGWPTPIDWLIDRADDTPGKAGIARPPVNCHGLN